MKNCVTENAFNRGAKSRFINDAIYCETHKRLVSICDEKRKNTIIDISSIPGKGVVTILGNAKDKVKRGDKLIFTVGTREDIYQVYMTRNQKIYCKQIKK